MFHGSNFRNITSYLLLQTINNIYQYHVNVYLLIKYNYDLDYGDIINNYF